MISSVKLLSKSLGQNSLPLLGSHYILHAIFSFIQTMFIACLLVSTRP